MHRLATTRSSVWLGLLPSVTMMTRGVKSLGELHFDNRVLAHLPIDCDTQNYVRTVRNACFSRVKPTPLRDPRLVCFSESALRLLDIESHLIDEHFIECFAGNQLIEGSDPAAHCYCGHQFGSFAGQLGDGAAIYLGEIVNSKNERWELQLKGAGPTPYSREADGRKVLRSSLREFLCSEAMHHLGIDTTRAATCIVSEDKVIRDQFYDGNAKMEKCAVISRIAPSFLRFGSFEIFKPLDRTSGRRGPSLGRHDILTSLANFAIESLYPAINGLEVSAEEKYKEFYKQVVIRTARLVAKWQAVGFCHGVLNTDNMSILGLTIDYGPFGFIDRFDPDHIPNTSDNNGRYRFKKQPEVCCWNLLKFAETLTPLVEMDQLKEILNEHYFSTYNNEYIDIMLKKLGLFKKVNNGDEIPSDEEIITQFLEALATYGGDYTNSFRCLNLLSLPGLSDFDQSLLTLKKELIQQSSSLEEMKSHYEQFVNSPMVYMRMVLLQNFGQQLENDDNTLGILKRLQHYKQLSEISANKYEEERQNTWNEWIDKYIKRITFETRDIKDDESELKSFCDQRKQQMNSNNPRYVLRNSLAETAIQKAESGDFTEAKNLLSALEDPFNEKPEFERYTSKPSLSECRLKVSCSS